MLPKKTTSLFLPLLLEHIVWKFVQAQLGFVCEGLVEFHAEIIGQQEKDSLFFYSASSVSDLSDCARTCYIKEFCRSAVFDTRTTKCEHSYFKGYCNDEVEKMESFKGSGYVQMTCIKCQKGYRVPERLTTDQSGTARSLGTESQSSKPDSNMGLFTRPRIVQIAELNGLKPSPSSASISSDSDIDNLSTENSGSRLGSLVSSRRFGLRVEQTTQKIPTQIDFDFWSQNCYVGVRQTVILGGGFAVERGVTLLECQCLCAESWQSGRYDIQCKAIMYYPEISECVLCQQNKQNRSHPIVRVDSEYPVNYFDFTCYRTEQEIGSFVANVCRFVQAPATTTVSSAPASKVSDMCYVEVKEHLLRGAAKAIQSRVSLKECKCLCASSHEPGNTSMGFQCMSVMYYYDEEFCIMNNDDRLQRPDLFMPDVTSYSVTYYGFSCGSNDEALNLYMTDHCANDTDSSHHPTHFRRI